MTVANTARSTANSTAANVATLDPQVAAATQAVTTLPTTLAQAAAEHATLRDADAAEKAARQAADTALQAAVDALATKSVLWETASYTQPVAVLVNGNLTLTFAWESSLTVAPTKVRLLSPVAVTNISYGTPTTTGCTVTCKAGLAVAIGARFHLLAIRFA